MDLSIAEGEVRRLTQRFGDAVEPWLEITPGTALWEIGRYPGADDLAALLMGPTLIDPPAQPFPALSQRITYLFASWQRPAR